LFYVLKDLPLAMKKATHQQTKQHNDGKGT
jgi:hypothetical protein